ncbi:helix-turn-helix transcriptional regulator [Bradyrhizobium sp. Tv2a-2]|uniref:helix-turn-helix transcriptional regulator n=1 Tax=Bradyrhizobium sp. Tv2a-2 TaxID=113395 RepID=UPI0004233A58|nr:helix-turn-helix transcriptional regulator [Bradyrhizobium sp. Tv2a-2]
MAEGGTLTFSNPDAYAAAFADVRLNLTITGAGDFRARLTSLKLNLLGFYQCREDLPRIAYMRLPPGQLFLSFPASNAALTFNGFALRAGDIILHARGGRMHHRIGGRSHWGLISVSPEQLASHSAALTGEPFTPPDTDKILRPARPDTARFRRLFEQACHLSEVGQNLIERPEVARALGQEMLHAVIHCLAADQIDDASKTRRQHAAIMSRFEEALDRHFDRKLNLPALCAEIGVAERTLRMCCAEFLGVSPMRYLLLRRLNKARSALRRADPSIVSVAEVARNHQFLELGRFSVTYRNTFGESPSATLQREPRPQLAGKAMALSTRSGPKPSA